MRLLQLAALAALLLNSAKAQTGSVKSEGQPLPGATVRATQGDRVLTTLTDASGEYKLANLGPGAWSIEVSMFGFEASKRDVQIGASPVKTDFSLQLAAFPVGFGRGGFGGAGGPGGVGRGAANGAPPTQDDASGSASAGNGNTRGGNGRGGFGQGGFGRGGFGQGGVGQGGAAGANRGPGNGANANGPGAQARNQQNQNPDEAGTFSPDAGQIMQADAGQNPADAAQANASGANESFLVNGSLSTGLQTQPGDFVMGPGGPFGGVPNAAFGSQMGGQIPGQAPGQGVPGQTPGQPGGPVVMQGGGGGPVMIQGGPGGGGFGGGPGGFGGGGFGGGRFGGPGGRGGRGPQRPGFPGGGFIGNRRNAGRSEIRGSVFYTGQSSVFNAAPFSVNGQSGTQPSYAQNHFGLTLGGPLEIPKLFKAQNTFFFVNYTGNLARNASTLTSTVPTLAERGGDFSASTSLLYDPTSHLPIPGNRISSISPIAQGLLAFIPVPNQPGNVNNFRLVTAVPSNSENLNVRVIQSLSRRDNLSFGVGWQQRDFNSAQNFGFIDQSSGDGVNANVSYRHTFGAGIFENLMGNFNRNTSVATPFFANGTNVAGQLGILGTSSNPVNFGPPNLNFTNFGALSDGSPAQSAIYSMGFTNLFAIRKGRNNWSMGGGYTRFFNNTVTDSNGRGTFTFTGLATSQLDAAGQAVPGTGLDFADFLLGLPQTNSIRFGSSNTYFRTNAYNLFVQDDFRVRNNLTLNLGLRYEYFAPWHEKYGRIANLAIAPNFTGVNVVTPAAGSLPSGLIQPDRNNFGPRLGLAWKPSSKSSVVVRLGYGIYYNPGIYNQFMSRLSAQPPFATSTSVVTSVQNPLTLATGLTVTPNGKTVLNTFAVNTDYHTMYAQSWNVSVQSNLPGQLVGELSYLGTKGTRLDIMEAPNQAPPGSVLTAQQRTVIGNATGFTYDTPDGNSIYHAGQARLTRRFRRGISGNLLYTFAKAIDNSSTLGGAGNTVAQNFYDLAAERGLSSFNRQHSFTANFVIGSPLGGTSNLWANRKFLAAAFKDWTLAPSVTLQTGTPLTARVLGNQSDIAGTGTIGSGRAEATGLPLYAGSGFFDLAAFTTPPAGDYGNAGRNTITGPGTFSMNLSLQRTIPLTERVRLNIRVDASNITNHVNITSLGTVVNSLNYGVATAAGAMRTLSLTVRLNF